MKITQHKTNGIYLDFNNGLGLSTVWGYGNYCDNYDRETPDHFGMGRQVYGSSTVEFMFTRGDSKLIKRLCKKYGRGENPAGYVPVDVWIKMIAHIQRLQSKHVDK